MLLAAGHELTALDRNAVDLEDTHAVDRAIREISPEIVINAAAFTAVDGAEENPSTARAVNAEGPATMARSCADTGSLLVHYSTDYVFDGSGSVPYAEDDPTGPINEYGRSKLAGEEGIRASGAAYLILRTSWVFAKEGHNFVNTMLRLGCEGRDSVRVVQDQRGAPTYAPDLARATHAMIARFRPDKSGVYHVTGNGETSWFGFAQEIFRIAGYPEVQVVPVGTRDFPTPARRPRYSVLSNRKVREVFGLTMPHWNDALNRCLSEPDPG